MHHTLDQAGSANYSASAKDVRDNWTGLDHLHCWRSMTWRDKPAAYFVSQGQVYWQWKRAKVVVPATNELNPEHSFSSKYGLNTRKLSLVGSGLVVSAFHYTDPRTLSATQPDTGTKSVYVEKSTTRQNPQTSRKPERTQSLCRRPGGIDTGLRQSLVGYV